MRACTCTLWVCRHTSPALPPSLGKLSHKKSVKNGLTTQKHSASLPCPSSSICTLWVCWHTPSALPPPLGNCLIKKERKMASLAQLGHSIHAYPSCRYTKNIQPPGPVQIPAFAPSGSAGERGPYYAVCIALWPEKHQNLSSAFHTLISYRDINMAIGMMHFM